MNYTTQLPAQFATWQELYEAVKPPQPVTIDDIYLVEYGEQIEVTRFANSLPNRAERVEYRFSLKFIQQQVIDELMAQVSVQPVFASSEATASGRCVNCPLDTLPDTVEN